MTRDRVIRPRESHGFTLIELMVVVTVVVLLISLLLPSMVRAREQALRVQCASNHKQISMAATFFADTNDDWLPYNTDISSQSRHTDRFGNVVYGSTIHSYDIYPDRCWTKLYDFLPDPGTERRDQAHRQVLWCPSERNWEHTPGDGRPISPGYSKWNIGYQWRFIAPPNLRNGSYFWGNPPWHPVLRRLVRSSEAQQLSKVDGGKCVAHCLLNNGDAHEDLGRNYLFADGSSVFIPFPTGEEPILNWATNDSPMPKYEWLDRYVDRN